MITFRSRTDPQIYQWQEIRENLGEAIKRELDNRNEAELSLTFKAPKRHL